VNLEAVRDGGVLRFDRVRNATLCLAQGPAAGVGVANDRARDIAASGRARAAKITRLRPRRAMVEVA